MTTRLACATVLVVAAAPAAWGCPVCLSGDADTLRAYAWSTTMLSLLPFGVIGAVAGAGYLLSQRFRDAPAADLADHRPG